MKKIILLFAIVLYCVPLYAQRTTVSGVVTDETGASLIGVTVIEKGTATGTTTNTDGRFSLQVGNSAGVLQFSYVGYETKEMPVNKQTRINVALEPAATDVEEVVVVGYGVQRKQSVVGAISTATSEDLKQMGSPNLSNALAGKVAGVTFTVASGRPGGDDASIYIRGVSTLNAQNSKPLVLVDGVEREYSQVDPDDVAQMSVLKDASATAVYGVRGANGVILITTKRGTSGAPKISLSYKFTLQQPTRMPHQLGSYQHALLRNESLTNDGSPLSFSEEDKEHFRLGDSPYTHPDNDYAKDFLKKTTPMHTINFSVSGGTPKVKYYVSLSGLYQDGIYKQFDGKYPSNANSQKLNLRSNLDFAITKYTDLSLDLNGRLNQRQNNSQGIDDNSIFASILETPPMSYPYLLPDGSYGASSNAGPANLMAILSDWGYTRIADNILEGTVKLNQRLDFLTEGLSARGLVSFNSYYATGTKISYRPPTYLYIDENNKEIVQEEEVPSISSLSGAGHRRRTNIEIAINYNRTFGDHAVSAMAIYTQTQSSTNAALPQAFLGYSGRVTYAYRNKYLAEANIGYNGSDQFDKDHRYGFFPAFSMGWVVSEEKFMEKAPWVSFLKIRGTYGEVGNDQIGTDRFLFLQTFDKDGNYFFGVDNAFGPSMALVEGALGNTSVTWEIGKKANIGFDLELFKHLTINFDVFRENRENIFIPRKTVPSILGVGTSKENLGRVRNQGFEIEAGYRANPTKDFSWNIRGMFSYSKNKILFEDEVVPKYEYLRRTGKQVGQFFGQTVLRYYLSDDFVMVDGVRTLNPDLPQPQYPVQPGDFMYWDRNEDGVVDSFDEGPIGSTRIPRYVYNLSYGLRWKGFDFNMMWQGAGGHNKLMTKSLYEPVRDENRFQDIHLYRWTEERWRNGEEIRYPRLSSVTNKHNQCTNTFYLRNGNYLRLKSVEIGYTFNKRQLRKIGLSSLRVYVGGNNLATFSQIENFDPEMGSDDGYFYPQMKMWNMGFNIGF